MQRNVFSSTLSATVVERARHCCDGDHCPFNIGSRLLHVPEEPELLPRAVAAAAGRRATTSAAASSSDST